MFSHPKTFRMLIEWRKCWSSLKRKLTYMRSIRLKFRQIKLKRLNQNLILNLLISSNKVKVSWILSPVQFRSSKCHKSFKRFQFWLWEATSLHLSGASSYSQAIKKLLTFNELERRLQFKQHEIASKTFSSSLAKNSLAREIAVCRKYPHQIFHKQSSLKHAKCLKTFP